MEKKSNDNTLNEPRGKSRVTSDDDFNSNSREYKLSTAVSFAVSDLVGSSIGDVMSYLEASLAPGQQTDALKRIIKERLWSLTRQVQHQVYYAFGQEPYQIGDTLYIRDVLEGKDERVLAEGYAEGEHEAQIDFGDVPKDL